MNILVLGKGKTGSLVAEVAQQRGHTVTAWGGAENPAGGALTKERLKDFDAVIDFTTPTAVMENIRACARAGKNMVVGTTGWYANLGDVHHLAESSGIGFLYGSNFSIGVNIFFEIAHTASSAVRLGYAAKISERHHTEKKDAPSGTAVTLQKILGAGAGPEQLPEIRKKSIGFVFQQYNLFPSLTALENVQYALKIKGKTGSGARSEALRVLESVGLSDRLNFLPRDLSGGQKQRVALARALAGGPPLLLADEPTANLDTQIGGQVIELFRQSAKQHNRGVLIVTHDPKVRPIADRVLQIRDGKILQ